MDVHSAPVVGKRMWSYLRAVFFMMRKSKRKLLLGMHLLMKRRNKAVARTVANLLSHHHHGHALRRRREYEFSCSDSPDTGSFSMRRPLAYFPCLGAEAQLEEPLHAEPAHAPLRRIEYYAAASPAPSSPGALMMHEELAPGEEMECTPGRMSPLVPSAADGGGFSSTRALLHIHTARDYTVDWVRRRMEAADWAYLSENTVAADGATSPLRRTE
jgi:hypothetical protein